MNSKISFILIVFFTLFATSAPKLFPENKQIFLNHLYVIVDRADYEAIEASEFIKNEFSAYEKRTTKRNDGSYSGFYLYGMNTYFEFFNSATTTELGAANPLAAPIGIAFGVDEAHAFQPPIGMNWEISNIKRSIKDQDGKETQVPWFKEWVPELPDNKESSSLVTWLMEYESEFLKLWHSEEKTPQGITRREVLTRYKSVVGFKNDDKLFQDILEVQIELPKNDLEIFLKKAKSFGCEIKVKGSSNIVKTLNQIFYVSEGAQSKVKAIKVSLKKSATPKRLQFGKNTVLDIKKNKTATWIFETAKQ